MEATVPAAGEPAEAADGKAVFQRLCTACHRFEERLVGPPLQSVLPKYRGNVEELKAFIRNPSKQDPAYPAMPKLPLREAEIDAVARYLLERATP
jgi:cytochrome c551/c552